MIFEKIILGITFAAPIGPVSAEAIRRGLLGGFLPAFRIKFGAAIGDTLILIATFYGISFIQRYKFICDSMTLIGALVLITLGLHNIYKSLNYNYAEIQKSQNNKSGLALGFGLAITNPFAIAWWLSIFSAYFNSAPDKIPTLMENMYIIIGVLIWDVILCTILEGGRKFLSNTMIQIINLLAGVSLTGFGLYFGYKAVNTLTFLI